MDQEEGKQIMVPNFLLKKKGGGGTERKGEFNSGGIRTVHVEAMKGLFTLSKRDVQLVTYQHKDAMDSRIIVEKFHVLKNLFDTHTHTHTHTTTQHNTTQHNTTQHNTTQHNTTQHNTTQHNTTHTHTHTHTDINICLFAVVLHRVSSIDMQRRRAYLQDFFAVISLSLFLHPPSLMISAIRRIKLCQT